jgi:glycopeptide antibiotics resistance protein
VLTAEGLWNFLTGPAALAVIVATLAVAWPLGRRLADRYQCPRAAAVLFIVTVGLILALTLTPSEPTAGIPRPLHFVYLLDSPRLVWAQLIAPPDDSEELANIAIYLPAGFLGRHVWGSVARATGAGLALTVFVETCQYGVIGRAGSITDIRNNALGAFIGAVLAATVVHARRYRADPIVR